MFISMSLKSAWLRIAVCAVFGEILFCSVSLKRRGQVQVKWEKELRGVAIGGEGEGTDRGGGGQWACFRRWAWICACATVGTALRRSCTEQWLNPD